MSSLTRPPLLIDCDTGIDDALAILYLLLTATADIKAITTVGGNTTALQAATNTMQILELAGRPDIPVGIGSEKTMTGHLPGYAPEVHGFNGLGNAQLPAPSHRPSDRDGVDLIIKTAREAGGQLSVLAIGPLTNLALALREKPGLAKLVKRITVMGGAIHHPGNGTPAAEANIANDPEAAELVFNAGWDLTLVPLDVTMREVLTETHRTRLLSHPSPACQFAGQALDIYFSFHQGRVFNFRGGPCHDPLAAAVAVGNLSPHLAPRVHVSVDTANGLTRGSTIADTRGMYRGYPPSANANAAVVLKTDGTFPDLLTEVLCSGEYREEPNVNFSKGRI
jgi:purine nucleosidase